MNSALSANASTTTSQSLKPRACCRLVPTACLAGSPLGARWVARRALRQSSPRCDRRRHMAARSMMEPEGELDPGVQEGTRIKVTKEVTIYHAPKTPEMQLEGKEGVVKMIVKNFKGKDLSANLPYRIEFPLESDSEKPKKVLVHMDASEFEAIS